MALVFTGPLLNRLTPQVRRKIERAYSKFPELADRRVIVGITHKRGLDGYAVVEDFCIRLNVNRRTVSHFTIGHELMHLLQKPGLGIIPDGEIQCDIWTLTRSELFLDEMPSYLEVHPCTDETWEHHATLVRELCIRAIEVRRSNRRYIVWLKNMLQRYLDGPIQLELFPAPA
ncbi:MAG: hypothetical protein V3S55_11980 [Nitrospiraceae bacterium]